MGRLQWALSWLAVVAVGLAPMLVYWAAGVIGLAFRRKRGGPRIDIAAVHTEGRSGPAGARRLRRGQGSPSA